MNDRAVNLLEEYDVEVFSTRKGRGAILCETSRGCLIFKEYQGNEERIAVQNRLLEYLHRTSDLQVESVIPTGEGQLFVKDGDGTRYVLKTYMEGRECNINDRTECAEVARQLARLHNHMEIDIRSMAEENSAICMLSPGNEYKKRNRELKRVYRYLKQRSQKTWFEISLLQSFDKFMKQASEVAQEWASYEEARNAREDYGKKVTYCHGDYQYHNILKTDKGWFVMNFEKCAPDDPVRDLYLLMRKLLEKSGWPVALGRELMDAYETVRPISAMSRIDLYYRLAYPEKFWKIANFYYNSGKAWIPGRNLEKLEKLIAQEEEKQEFLDVLFRKV